VDRFSAHRIRAELDAHSLAWEVVYLDQVGSTNVEACRLAEAGAQHRTLVIADYQVSGRGRHGRRWIAPPGTGLLMSLILRPCLEPGEVPWLTMIGGLAVVDAIESQARLAACLKWPNDIVVNGFKVGGILSEVEFRGEQLLYVVLGIGLNVNLELADLPKELLVPAAGLSYLLGHQVPRLCLLISILRSLETRYQALGRGNNPTEEWANRLVTVGQRVTVSAPSGAFEGHAEGVDGEGALLVRQRNGRLARVWAADVSLRSLDTP
jgi:BirA family transcriptional regulator, biotin operon repressor / biotin---[acetyl-CoA-carboxylase] ligase